MNSILAQTNPEITSWLQNTTLTGSYYVSGNSNVIDNGILANCQQVEYSTNFVYVSTNGIPAYPTGPFQDGNPSQASAQNAIYKFPLNPVENTGTPTSTTGGNIGVFVNGVSLFDYRDGVGWNSNNNSLCGGPGNSPCPGGPMAGSDWSRDAIPAEMDGFDCSKGHPANGNYHHHQNPSAFKLDINTVSTICNLYDADGLYGIDSNMHSPLIGFAYDGFPIYGAYGYKNNDGTGGIERIKSSYELRNITSRTHHADGTDVDNGPNVNATYWLGYFREDYEFIDHPTEDDYLDEHNGRFCVTPEYPMGTYAYFATVDEDWNSAYPYVVGPTFYGVYANRKVNNISETTTIYTVPVFVDADNDGVQDSDDQCPGFDDNLDADMDGIPDDCDYVQVELNVLLEGALIDGSNQMRTDLNNNNLLPINHPYDQAPYNNLEAISNPNPPASAVDWILIEARYGDPTSGSLDLQESHAAFLLGDGSIVSNAGSGPVIFRNLTNNVDYYFTIRHRNHLDIISEISLSTSNGNVTYDFTASNAYGTEQQQTLSYNGGMINAMYAGDYNQDQVIQNTDYDKWKINPSVLNTYDPVDGNLDGTIQVTDFDRWTINKSKNGVNLF